MSQLGSAAEKLSRPLRAVDRIVARAGELGPGVFAFPLIVGTGLGAGTLFILGLFGGGKKPAGPHLFDNWTAVAVASLVAAVVTTGGFALIGTMLRRRGGDLAPMSFAQLWCRRFAFIGALPLLSVFASPIEVTEPWFSLVAAAIAGALVTVSAYYFMSEDARPSMKRAVRYVAGGAVVVAILLYVFFIGRLSILNHLAFNTGRSDLGFYVNIFRQSSLGVPLGCSLCGGSHVTGHFDPILVLVSPIYLIYPFAETILVLQAAWLASGAIPLYLLARRSIEFRGASIALVAAYLLYPALHGANLFDFHSLALCIPLLLWLVYFLERGVAWGYFLSLALVLLVREDMPLALVGVALYAIFSRLPHGARYGWTTLVAAAAYFIAVKAFIMHSPDPLNTVNGVRGYAYFYEELVPPGTSTVGLVGTLLTNPAYVLHVVLTEPKLLYAAQLLIPLGALPLLARGRIMLAYGAALTLLASRPFLHSIYFQYSSVLIPFVFALAAAALGRIRNGEIPTFGLDRNRLARALCLGVLMTTSLVSWDFGALIKNGSFHGGFRPLQRNPTAQELARAAFLKKVSSSFPKNARAAANSRLMTHLGSTMNIFLLDDRYEADYVVTMDAKTALGRQIAQEVKKGELREVQRFADVHVYKTHYPAELVKHARQKREARKLARAKAGDLLRERAFQEPGKDLSQEDEGNE